jgi:hypothetical protein
MNPVGIDGGLAAMVKGIRVGGMGGWRIHNDASHLF